MGWQTLAGSGVGMGGVEALPRRLTPANGFEDVVGTPLAGVDGGAAVPRLATFTIFLVFNMSSLAVWIDPFSTIYSKEMQAISAARCKSRLTAVTQANCELRWIRDLIEIYGSNLH